MTILNALLLSVGDNRRTIVNIAVCLIVLTFIFNGGTAGYWLFIVIFAYFAVRLVISIIKSYLRHIHNKDASRREYVVKMTARLMGLFFVTGTLLYAFTFPAIEKHHDVTYNNAELIMRSLICSLDMFMLDVDSNILDRLDNEPLLKGALVVQAGISFLCTITLLVSLIFSRAKAYYTLHRKTKITAEKCHLYVFFGVNENSKLLARDIHANDAGSIIIFVDDANINDDENDSWDNIVNLFTHKQKTFDFADESSALVAIASKQLCDIDEDRLQATDCDVLSIIELDRVKAIIRSLQQYPGESQLHIFFLSDNEDNNIRSLINLAKDKTILSVADDKGVPEKIYCHARYNGPNRVVEDLAVRKGLDVEIVDSSHLAVELLKSKAADQPVRVASLSEEYPTTVTRPIEALIVGFGEVGRDAFRFIYEFGTFIQVCDGEAKTAKPRITAIDSKMDTLDGAFEANTPAISYGGEIALKQIDCHSVRFYDSVLTKELCQTINYIVLALGDDDQNIALATNIFNRIRRYRESMSGLIIMVRCVKDEKREMMEKIADHYNKGCGDGDIHVIRLFGNPKEIYSYDTIIRDSLTRKGIAFMENYQNIRCENDTWAKRRERLTGISVRNAGEIIYPNIDNLRKLRRQESQDLANALHTATKMWLLQQAFGAAYDWNDFINRIFDISGSPTISGEMAAITYPHLTTAENRVMLYLAMLEHARWNAAHELLGYNRNDTTAKCDEKTLLHNCLKDWDELDGESHKASSPDWKCDYKSYDFSVVNTSVALTRDELGKITRYDN